ncbi:hypothetical protein [Nodosilinea sp. LEGE 07088]|uniref:hypothetical protein n=1 Tax=Nodosilinea sp. LEGE 07088 TaxID=2777968 RepID=UPI001D14980F|nr:hypothetical protein [Nodosilinea sp. LEGE 07088]
MARVIKAIIHLPDEIRAAVTAMVPVTTAAISTASPNTKMRNISFVLFIVGSTRGIVIAAVIASANPHITLPKPRQSEIPINAINNSDGAVTAKAFPVTVAVIGIAVATNAPV